MGYTPVELALVKGLPSSASLGNTGVTDLVPTTIDFLTGAYVLYDDGSNPAYDRALPVIKNGGVWVDSTMMSGRQLVAAKNGNVIDVVQLRPVDSATSIQRDQYISRLNRFISAASEFWATGGTGDPVYLRYKEQDAPGEQYALIYTIEPDDDGDTLTLTIEREPAWRPLPPGLSPKVWKLQQNGLTPSTVSGTPAAGQYNHNDIELVGGIGLKAPVVGSPYRCDEIISTARAHFVIPAELIPGDAPALAMFNVGQGVLGGQWGYFARSTRRDLYPNNNNNTATQMMRYTFNGGDSAIFTPGALVMTKVIDALYGVRSNATLANRYYLRGAGAAAGYADTGFAQWTRAKYHYARRWMVFARIRVASGNAANHKLRVTIGNNAASTPPRSLAGVGTSFMLFYLGELDGSVLDVRSTNGKGINTDSTVIEARLAKTNDGVASQVDLIDLVFLPLDEQVIKINEGGSGGTTDNTGYFSFETVPLSILNSIRAEASGQPITLVPGVDNTIIHIDDFVGELWFNAPNNVTVQILPRWYGVRDV